MSLLDNLLRRGYFPRELPPQFSTARYAQRMAGPNALPLPAANPPKSSFCVDHNVPRGGSLRRVLRIPNPIHYYHLAKHVMDNWVPLKTLADASRYSLTKPSVVGERALNPENSLRSRVAHRARVRATGRYLIRADVTRFYASVYTHALPWAILGKAEAKRRFASRTLSSDWSDRLDALVRRMNGDQTVGIPTGPDVSLLLAEVLLASVDVHISQVHPSVQGIRYIDDYELVTQTQEEADNVLAALQAALREIDLDLNSSKTSITPLPAALTEPWVSALRRLPIEQEKRAVQHEDLTEFFGLMFENMKRFPEDQVLKYGLGRLSRLVVHEDNWRFYEHLLQQCIAADPACLPQVAADVEYYRSHGHELNLNWPGILNQTVVRHLPIGNSSENVWAMALLLQFGLPLSSEAATAVSTSGDSLSALMGLMLARVGLANSNDLGGLKRFLSPNYLYAPDWLLCYEANVWQWLGSDGSALSGDPWFHHLRRGPAKDIVTFLDLNAVISPAAKHHPEEDQADDNDDDDNDFALY